MLRALEQEKSLWRRMGEYSQFTVALEYLKRYHLSLSPEVISAFDSIDKSRYLSPMFDWLDHNFNIDHKKAGNIAFAAIIGQPAAIWSDGVETINMTSTMLMGVMVDKALVEPQRRRRVLVAGSGTGYVPAVLASKLVYHEVVAVEIRQELAEISSQTLKSEVVSGVRVVHGNAAYFIYHEMPFDSIIVFATVDPLDQSWVIERFKRKLTLGGRMVLPEGPPDSCILRAYQRMSKSEFDCIDVLPVEFTNFIT